MAAIELEKVEKWFGTLQVLKGLDLSIGDGEFVVLVGPSGCGKTTLLRLIAGLEEVSAGWLALDGEDVTDKVPSERRLSMVFQSYALYPHMTVGQNMGFGLKTAGTPRALIDEKVGAAARSLRLEPLLGRRPKELSGGQRQRVAIGRAIVREPRAFLFDEPLSNLDAALRVEMRVEIARLHEQLGTTMVYVTHDQVEAMTLADRIVLMDAGRIMQVGTPRELYERPANLFVAEFIGSPRMNVMDCAIDGERYALSGQRGGAHGLGAAAAQASRIGVRPEHIEIVEAGQGSCDGDVTVIEYLGSESYAYVDCAQLGGLMVRGVDIDPALKGRRVGLRFDEARLHFFAADGAAVRAN